MAPVSSVNNARNNNVKNARNNGSALRESMREPMRERPPLTPEEEERRECKKKVWSGIMKDCGTKGKECEIVKGCAEQGFVLPDSQEPLIGSKLWPLGELPRDNEEAINKLYGDKPNLFRKASKCVGRHVNQYYGSRFEECYPPSKNAANANNGKKNAANSLSNSPKNAPTKNTPKNAIAKNVSNTNAPTNTRTKTPTNAPANASKSKTDTATASVSNPKSKRGTKQSSESEGQSPVTKKKGILSSFKSYLKRS